MLIRAIYELTISVFLYLGALVGFLLILGAIVVIPVVIIIATVFILKIINNILSGDKEDTDE